MWTKTKWTLRIVAALLALGFLHYTLPQHDIVKITGTYNRLTTIGSENAWAYASPDTGTADAGADTAPASWWQQAATGGGAG